MLIQKNKNSNLLFNFVKSVDFDYTGNTYSNITIDLENILTYGKKYIVILKLSEKSKCDLTISAAKGIGSANSLYKIGSLTAGSVSSVSAFKIIREDIGYINIDTRTSDSMDMSGTIEVYGGTSVSDGFSYAINEVEKRIALLESK